MSASDAAPVPAAPNEYSPEAIVAYPAFPEDNAQTVWANNLARAAFDLGMKAGRDAALTEAADAAAKVLDNASRIGSGTLRSTAIAMIPAAIRSLQEGNTHD